MTDPETAVGDHALVLRLLALIACVRGGKERCQDLMEQSETLLRPFILQLLLTVNLLTLYLQEKELADEALVS